MANRTHAGPACNFFSPIYDFYIVIFTIPGLMEPQLWFLRPVRLKLGFFIFFLEWGRGSNKPCLMLLLIYYMEMAGIGHL